MDERIGRERVRERERERERENDKLTGVVKLRFTS